MTTIDDIKNACITHGAKAVHDAAYQYMRNNHNPMSAIGLECQSIGDADAIMSAAFKLLSASDKAADHAGAIAGLELTRIISK